jgi:predicted RND superfamily exporter protein
MAFHGGDRAWYRLPDDQETLAQLLLVYELSGGKEMNDVLNLDRSKTALQVRLQLVAASEVRDFLESMDHYLVAHPPKVAKVEITGIGLLWVRMAEYISDTQLQAYAITFAAIALFMVLTFGSVRLGLLAMVPNLFPIVMILGIMGWLGWTLDYFRLLLATIAIGIAVDDTIHFVSSYKREFEHCGRYEEALRRTMPEVGPAMFAMTIILVVAFSSYHASSMAIVASFGTLLTVTIGTAVLADLFLMPGLLMTFRPFGPERVTSGESITPSPARPESA